jgi:thioredoxin reductase (NADPH)
MQKIVAIAGGLGSFEPRKNRWFRIFKNLKTGVEYIIKEPELYR